MTVTLTPAARWTLSWLASFAPATPGDTAAVTELAAHGLIEATLGGWRVSRRGFAGLPAHEQESLRNRWNPPTRAECEREAAMWRRLESE